jgi:hypothetical protein
MGRSTLAGMWFLRLAPDMPAPTLRTFSLQTPAYEAPRHAGWRVLKSWMPRPGRIASCFLAVCCRTNVSSKGYERNVDNWRPCVQPSDEQMLDEARLGERSWASLR